MNTPSLLDLLDGPAPASSPRPAPRVLPRRAALFRDWRDAMMHVARSERAHGSMEAARICARQARQDHRRMMAAIRGGKA
jgi:hypothetical protein